MIKLAAVSPVNIGCMDVLTIANRPVENACVGLYALRSPCCKGSQYGSLQWSFIRAHGQILKVPDMRDQNVFTWAKIPSAKH